MVFGLIITQSIKLSPARRPCTGRAFDKFRRYHTRTSRFNWGLKNIHFQKNAFLVRFFVYQDKHRSILGANFLYFAIFTTIPKTAQKLVQRIFCGVFEQHFFDTQNLNFASENNHKHYWPKFDFFNKIVYPQKFTGFYKFTGIFQDRSWADWV